jgi:hypothetical protein
MFIVCLLTMPFLAHAVIKLTVAACLMYWVHLRPHDWTLPPVVMVWNQFLLEKTTKGVCPGSHTRFPNMRQ